MANTFTGLTGEIYDALDVTSRELTGFIPAVQKSSLAERVALGETITVAKENEGVGRDATPAMTPTAAADQTTGNVQLTINKQRSFPFNFTGDEVTGLTNGAGFAETKAGKIAQAIRGLVNEVETDIAATHISASRAWGTAGTTPFASSLTAAANAVKILDDNGAPKGERSMIINTDASVNLRGLGAYSKANEAGSTATLRQGALLDLYGLQVGESAQINTNTAGTGTGYLTNNPTGTVGSTVIAADTGTGTILAGDIVTFAGDTNKYVVETSLAAGSLSIAAPGLRQTLADGVVITVVGAAARNMAFSRNSILLASRMVKVPAEGDSAIDTMTIVDPVSGLPLEFAAYGGYLQNLYEVRLAWGVKVIKPEHLALVLG